MMHEVSYYPFASGQYSTAPGLHKLGVDFGNGAVDQAIFQVDKDYKNFWKNKENCRQENIHKYYQRKDESSTSIQLVNRFLLHQLLNTYPQYFSQQEEHGYFRFTNQLTNTTFCFDKQHQLTESSIYLSLMDALISQVPEDIAIWQKAGNEEYLSTIHLCSPNHWSPGEKISQPFSVVHAPVADMDTMRRRYQPMLKSLIRGGTFVRFAWGLGTDNRLNHHPEPPPGCDAKEWEGRSFDTANPQLFVRTERQTLTGFPQAEAVLFTIRTYFTDVQQLSAAHLKGLIYSVQSMSEESLCYKGLQKDKNLILEWLSKLSNK